MSVDLMFYRLARKNLYFCCLKPTTKEIVLSAKFKDNKGEFKIFAVESEREITTRIPYDENEVLKNAIFCHQKAMISKNAHFSFIEHLVSLNKALLLRCFMDLNRKFYFSRLELFCDFIRDFKKIEIFYRSHFNFQYFKSEIFVDEKMVGNIYFSQVKD